MDTTNITSKYAAVLLLIGPILQPYSYKGINLGVYLLFINAIILWIINLFSKKKTQNNKELQGFLTFYIYAFTLPVIVGLLLYGSNGLGASYRGMLVYAVTFPMLIKLIDFLFLKRTYTFIVFFLCAIFICQEFLYYTTGIRFSALIPFLDLNYDIAMEDFMADQMIKTRSSSMFLEPAHFSQYLVPCLALNMGKLIDEKRLMNVTVLFISLILYFLQSGSGMIMLGILYFLYFKKQKVKTSYLLCLFFILIALVLVVDANSNESILGALFERRNELSLNKNDIGSGMIRVFRGYYVYADFPLLGKIFGVGNGAVGDVVMNSSARWMFNDETYLNNFQKLIIGYGFIGSILFINYMKSLFAKGSFSGNAVLTCFIAVSFMENMFFDSKMLFYMCIAVCANQYYKIHKQLI